MSVGLGEPSVPRGHDCVDHFSLGLSIEMGEDCSSRMAGSAAGEALGLAAAGESGGEGPIGRHGLDPFLPDHIEQLLRQGGILDLMAEKARPSAALTEPFHGMLFDQFATAAQAAISGLGLALLPEFLIQN